MAYQITTLKGQHEDLLEAYDWLNKGEPFIPSLTTIWIWESQKDVCIEIVQGSRRDRIYAPRDKNASIYMAHTEGDKTSLTYYRPGAIKQHFIGAWQDAANGEQRFVRDEGSGMFFVRPPDDLKGTPNYDRRPAIRKFVETACNFCD